MLLLRAFQAPNLTLSFPCECGVMQDRIGCQGWQLSGTVEALLGCQKFQANRSPLSSSAAGPSSSWPPLLSCRMDQEGAAGLTKVP